MKITLGGDRASLPKTNSAEEIGLGNLLTLDAKLKSTLENIGNGTLNKDEFQLQETEPGRFIVVAATFDRLLTYITSETSARDDEIMEHIIFTYSYFTDVQTFLSKIISRLCSMTTENKSKQMLTKSLDNRHSVSSSTDSSNPNAQKRNLQFQLLNLLKRWMRVNASIFRQDPTFEATLDENLQKMMGFSETSIWVESVRETYNSSVKNKRVPQRLPSFDDLTSLPFANFLEIPFKPEEIAQQMTLIEFDCFRNIEATKELLHKCFTKEETSPMLHQWIGLFNIVTGWVSKEILHHADPKNRGIAISRYIDIAHELFRLKNFNGMMQVVMALNQTSISRLKQSWKNVSTRHMTKFDELVEMMNPSNNNGAYRKALNRVLPPLIPFQAVILKDLTFIEESPDTIGDSSHIINFTKMSLLGNLLKAIQKAQTVAFNFPQLPPLLNYFRDLSSVTIPDEKTLYNISKSLESSGSNPSVSTPREKKKPEKSCSTCSHNLIEIEEKKNVIRSLKREIDEVKNREVLLRDMLVEKFGPQALSGLSPAPNTLSNSSGASSSSLSQTQIPQAVHKKLSARGVSSSVLTPYDLPLNPALYAHALNANTTPLRSSPPSNHQSPRSSLPINSSLFSGDNNTSLSSSSSNSEQLKLLLEVRNAVKSIEKNTAENKSGNGKPLEDSISSAYSSLNKLIATFEESIT